MFAFSTLNYENYIIVDKNTLLNLVGNSNSIEFLRSSKHPNTSKMSDPNIENRGTTTTYLYDPTVSLSGPVAGICTGANYYGTLYREHSSTSYTGCGHFL